jgi:topoisomerase IA-like protein
LNNRIDNQIDDLVGALTDPIIAFPGGWEDTIPDWIKEQITLERLAQNMKALKGEKMTATDAEVCAYLYTRSLEAPMDSDWTRIYLYVAGKVIARARNIQVPEDIKVESLTDDQMRDLQELKDWIYQRRVKHRQEKRRAEKAKTRAEAEARAPVQLGLGV